MRRSAVVLVASLALALALALACLASRASPQVQAEGFVSSRAPATQPAFSVAALAQALDAERSV